METERGGLTGLRPLPQLPIAVSEMSLFLDLDGTLAPFEDAPSLVGPQRRRNETLRRLGRRLQGRIAILSGRTLEDIDRILDAGVVAAAGVHGLERRSAIGLKSARAGHPALDQIQRSLQDLADRHPGLLVERKPQSVALHYRLAPCFGSDALALGARLASQWGLTVQNGRMVTELRTPGEDKGDALRAFLSEPPFIGSRPLMFGDDFTDEPAFAASAALGGFGVLVGPSRPTAAIFQAPDVASVLDWLDVLNGGDAVVAASSGATVWPA